MCGGGGGGGGVCVTVSKPYRSGEFNQKRDLSNLMANETNDLSPSHILG